MVNVGSVSNPWAPDLRASYALLAVDGAGVHVTFRRVAYDTAAALAALYRSGHPATEFIASFLRGERHPWWVTSTGRAWAGFPE